MFITQGKPVYTLSECLNSLSDNTVDVIFTYYKDIHNVVKGNIKSKKTKVEKLENIIPEMFKNFLTFMNKEDVETIEEYLKNKKINKSNITLLSHGFMFTFKENNKIEYVIPEELLEIYKKEYTKEFKENIILENVKKCFFVYGMMNGILEKDVFIKMLKETYHIELPVKEIEKFIKESKGHIYKDKYYTILNVDNEEQIDSLIKEKENSDISYKILKESELDYYMMLVSNWLKELRKIIKTNKSLDYDEASVLLSILSTYNDDIYDILDSCNNEFEIDEKRSSKLFSFLEENIDEFRFWDLNGNTIKEYEMNDALFYLIKELPKKRDLKSLLNSLSKEALEEIYLTYDIESDINELIKEIKEDFKTTIENLSDKEEIFALRNNHEDEFTVYTDTFLVETANLFIYQDDNQIKVIIPDELLEILDDNLKDYDYDEVNYVDDINDYVYEYMTANGFLEKEKLKELLYNHHNLDVSLDELDKLVKKETFVVKDNFYVVFDNFNKEELEHLKKMKDMQGDYKVCDYSTALVENNFIDELSDYLTSKNIKNKEDLIGEILTCINLKKYIQLLKNIKMILVFGFIIDIL